MTVRECWFLVGAAAASAWWSAMLAALFARSRRRVRRLADERERMLREDAGRAVGRDGG